MSQQQEILNNLLIEAVRNRDLGLARTYVKKGADPNCTAPSVPVTEKQSISSSMQRHISGPVLHLAAALAKRDNGYSWEMADFLIAAGAQIDAKNASGNTMLMVAIKAYDASAARYFLAKGASPMLSDANGNTALKLASDIDINASARQMILNAIMDKMPDAPASTAAQNNNMPQPAATVQTGSDIPVMKPVSVLSRRPKKTPGGGFNL